MSNCSRFLLLLLTTFIIVAFFPSFSKGEAANQQTETKLKITYFNINVELVDLDLVARRARFNLSGTLGLNFNASSDIYYVTVATMGSDLGQTRFGKVTSGLNSSVFQMYANESGFSGYFWGGPETYPFDRYRFNFTLSSLLQNVSLSADNVTFTYNVDWPLRAQFDEPSENFTSVTHSDSGPIVSVGYVLNRPEWRGYSTLLPIYLIFALLGFSTLIKIDSNKLTQRIAVYTAVLTSALAYSISVQNVLPSGRYYLSIPEALIYGTIGSAATFIISTLVACRFRISQILADTIAAVISQAFLSSLLLTFYFAKYVEIDSYQFTHILSTQWVIIGLVFIGILSSALFDFCIFLKNSKGSEKLRKERLDHVVKGTFWVSFFLELCTSCIVAYERFIQAKFEPGMLRNFTLNLAGNNVLLMILFQTTLTSVYLGSFYFISKRTRFSLLKDFFGLFFLFFSTFDFLTSFLLSFGDVTSVLILSVLCASECSVLFWAIRRRVKTPYEQFISWLGE
jgi:hypothetical protein